MYASHGMHEHALPHHIMHGATACTVSTLRHMGIDLLYGSSPVCMHWGAVR